ncbi:HNH endonuclease [Streptomyces sp. NPDC056165]|uniref:HNH endonuclease n=1 Tax=Streptomyces sp. NPDC056165 TaxID=3345733 RepID=UPI0035DB3938
MPELPSLRRVQHSALPLVQVRRHRPELLLQRTDQLIEATHTASTSPTTVRNPLIHRQARYFRSPAAREAVIIRSGGTCENSTCLGHPTERTDAGAPILEVDHVNDLGNGGDDALEIMIALCPNCHALKTRGSNRRQLRIALLRMARERHRAFLAGSL